MIANDSTEMAAASSTSAAAPAGSQPAKEQRSAARAAAQDADAEFNITAADVAEALGQLSDDPADDDQQTTAADSNATAKGDETDETEFHPDAAAEDSAAETDGAGESEEEAAATGDAAASASGDVDTKDSPAEEGADEKPKSDKDKRPFEKRYDELTARAKTAEGREQAAVQEAAQLREQLAALRAQSATDTSAPQIQAIDTPQDLQQEHRRIVQLHEWALKHEATGGRLPDGKGGEREFTPEDVLDLKANTFRMLQVDLPQRQHYLLQKQQADAHAAQAYPWINNTREGDGALVQSLIERMPGIRNLTPHYRVVAADALVGERLRSSGIRVTPELIERLKAEATKDQGQKPRDQAAKPAAQATAAATAPRKVPPQAPGRPGAIPARSTQRMAQDNASRKRLSRGDGNVNDLTASIASKFG